MQSHLNAVRCCGKGAHAHYRPATLRCVSTSFIFYSFSYVACRPHLRFSSDPLRTSSHSNRSLPHPPPPYTRPPTSRSFLQRLSVGFTAPHSITALPNTYAAAIYPPPSGTCLRSPVSYHCSPPFGRIPLYERVRAAVFRLGFAPVLLRLPQFIDDKSLTSIHPPPLTHSRHFSILPVTLALPAFQCPHFLHPSTLESPFPTYPHPFVSFHTSRALPLLQFAAALCHCVFVCAAQILPILPAIYKLRCSVSSRSRSLDFERVASYFCIIKR